MAILHKSKDDFSTLCRIGGLGYRALGRIDYKRSLRRGDLQCGSGPFYPSQYGAHVAVGADLSIHTAEWGPIWFSSYYRNFNRRLKAKNVRFPNSYFSQPGRRSIKEKKNWILMGLGWRAGSNWIASLVLLQWTYGFLSRISSRGHLS